MKRKNVTAEMMKEYIIESLIILLRDQAYNDITIKEITTKAGVNRSTYYRNFKTKDDIIKTFYFNIMDNYLNTLTDKTKLSREDYLLGMFEAFLVKKDRLLLLYQNNLSYLLLNTLNEYFLEQGFDQEMTFAKKYMLYYHTGGIFNSLLLWFQDNMIVSPVELMQQTISILPNDFKPLLLHHHF